MHSKSASDPRRRSARHLTENITCRLGEVVDLSAAGMRVVCRGRPSVVVGQTMQFRLQYSDGAITVTAQVLRIRRRGLRAREIGLRFVNLSSTAAAAVESLARFGFLAVDVTSVSDPQPVPPPSSAPRAVHVPGDVPDYYRLLQVSADATPEEISHAFRRLALVCHPDVTGDPEAMKRFATITQAYEVLKDPASRALYDLRTAA